MRAPHWQPRVARDDSLPRSCDAPKWAELARLWQQFTIVEITEGLLDAAGDLAEQEGLRGYDAVHLAAALQIGADLLTSADSDLCAAAGRRGLHVANPIDAAD